MADGVDPVFLKYRFHAVGIADIRLFKAVPLPESICQSRQIFRIARIGQLVHIDNPPREIRLFQQISNKVAADKPAAPCHHQILYFHFNSFSLILSFVEYFSFSKGAGNDVIF
ncbi:MAG: hypothetical protein A4E69_00209 [Syntrophus sp. PtaB.Bin138]|nr:MAG: hypothetical protein A4E69_00209 [Syntrophus sp. PtaB.Bin138]